MSFMQEVFVNVVDASFIRDANVRFLVAVNKRRLGNQEEGCLGEPGRGRVLEPPYEQEE